MKGRVLIVDDDRATCELLFAALRANDFDPHTRTTGGEALELLSREDFDVLVTDLRMKGMNGIDLCARVVETHPDLPVIVMSAFGSLESAVAAVRAGAYDYVAKPFAMESLSLTLTRAARHRALGSEVSRLRQAVSVAHRFGEIIGESPAMRRLYDLMDSITDSEATTLITGESGTGKELVARALHDRSDRRGGPFVAINSGAIQESLLESELFGHVKGAFTDAHAARKDLFVQAQGGTLFLDEIADMPMGVQVKLLRTLQERTVRPVGGDLEVAIDVRLLTATNRDLESAVEERRFREDLYYRLNVIHVELPPLRARGNDVLLIGQKLIDLFAARAGKTLQGLTSEVAARLLAYPWPGNVRELQNCIERAVAVTRGDRLTIPDLPAKIREYDRSHVIVASHDPGELVPMEQVERRYVLEVMEAVAGNKTLAARTLGFDRKTLYRKLEKYGYRDPE